MFKTFVYHKGPIASISWSPTSKLLASASYDKTVCVKHRLHLNGKKIVYVSSLLLFILGWNLGYDHIQVDKSVGRPFQ